MKNIKTQVWVALSLCLAVAGFNVVLAVTTGADQVTRNEKAIEERWGALNAVPIMQYETVAASQSGQAMGNPGAAGDFLHRVVCVVSTSGANGTCSIADGSGSAIPIVAANTPIGVYSVELNLYSVTGAWKLTTGSACTAIGIGLFH